MYPSGPVDSRVNGSRLPKYFCEVKGTILKARFFTGTKFFPYLYSVSKVYYLYAIPFYIQESLYKFSFIRPPIPIFALGSFNPFSTSEKWTPPSTPFSNTQFISNLSPYFYFSFLGVRIRSIWVPRMNLAIWKNASAVFWSSNAYVSDWMSDLPESSCQDLFPDVIPTEFHNKSIFVFVCPLLYIWT